ncbi:MAG: citrate lyase subunit alpha, partial [Candidatus Hodarchaeales archaeon]
MNSLGRNIPREIFGKDIIPFNGLDDRKCGRIPEGWQSAPRYSSSIKNKGMKKVIDSLDTLMEKLPIKDGMTVSFHHCLRNGDYVVNLVMEALAATGVKNITLAPTALFPVHKTLLQYINEGIIGRIEGSLNGPLGNALSKGEIDIPVILRSHGGRARAIQSGDIHVDVAFCAASSADYLGNLNGVNGPSAFGSIGFMQEADAIHADYFVGVTDNLQELPIYPSGIHFHHVDYVVTVDQIGDPKGIRTGSLGRKLKPSQEIIVENVINVIKHSGRLVNGLSYQAGAGGISLATTKLLEMEMISRKIKGSFILGGVTKESVDLMRKGLFSVIYNGQTFDERAIESLRDDPNHIEIPVNHSYCAWERSCVVNYLDFAVLGATEVDTSFNVNVNTFSNGLLNSGIGGHQDAAACRLSII